ncbi:MAG: tyrosine--tRNA ligase [bacterium]|nr:tyrosine--tRNA ligase [bacterium]
MDSFHDQALTWAVAELINETNLSRRLKQSKKLVVKLGVDPTTPDLHLGHAVVLRKLRQFQDLGHQAVLVIGDFTARIGDPAGVNKTRPILSEVEIKDNMETYLTQAGAILELKKARVLYNSSWLAKMNLSDLLGYAQQISLNTLIEREDFATRLAAKQSVGLHELLYPLTQAIDSVRLKTNIELGGWDQRLNLLLGRELQKKVGQAPQELVLMKPLLGLDGAKKMSSSLGNYIGLTDSSDQMFGKVMSIPDSMITHYGELAALMGTEAEVKTALKKLLPRDQKALVATKIVELYHGAASAKKALTNFNQTFRDKKVADHLASELSFSQKSVSLIHAVAEASQSSNTQANRLITQGAIKLNGTKMTDPSFVIELTGENVLQVGKRHWHKLGRRR